MRNTRIYQPIALQGEEIISLDKAATIHVLNVLRLTVNDPLIIFNGNGGEYSGKISHIERQKVLVRLEKFHVIERESILKIHLAQAISRGEKMDFTMQKAVELGVTKITPIITERCGVKISKERWNKRYDRWQKIIISACEQCGRNTLPQLDQAVKYVDWISQPTTKHKFILNPKVKKSFKQFDDSMQELVLLVGSEGGLTDNEIQLAEKFNFQSVSMGPRVLRTETAGLAAISILQYMHGDLG